MRKKYKCISTGTFIFCLERGNKKKVDSHLSNMSEQLKRCVNKL